MDRLNLGCGNDIRQGFDNLDMRKAEGVIYCDISKKLPYEDGSIVEIVAQDILEHFGFRETEPMLRDWVRTLRPGGIITIQVPNIEKHVKDYWNDRNDKRYINGYDNAMEFLRANIFGGQDYDGNYHKTCFTPNTLRLLLEKVGLRIMDITTQDRAIIAICQK